MSNMDDANIIGNGERTARLKKIRTLLVDRGVGGINGITDIELRELDYDVAVKKVTEASVRKLLSAKNYSLESCNRLIVDLVVEGHVEPTEKNEPEFLIVPLNPGHRGRILKVLAERLGKFLRRTFSLQDMEVMFPYNRRIDGGIDLGRLHEPPYNVPESQIRELHRKLLEIPATPTHKAIAAGSGTGPLFGTVEETPNKTLRWKVVAAIMVAVAVGFGLVKAYRHYAAGLRSIKAWPPPPEMTLAALEAILLVIVVVTALYYDFWIKKRYSSFEIEKRRPWIRFLRIGWASIVVVGILLAWQYNKYQDLDYIWNSTAAYIDTVRQTLHRSGPQNASINPESSAKEARVPVEVAPPSVNTDKTVQILADQRNTARQQRQQIEQKMAELRTKIALAAEAHSAAVQKAQADLKAENDALEKDKAELSQLEAQLNRIQSSIDALTPPLSLSVAPPTQETTPVPEAKTKKTVRRKPASVVVVSATSHRIVVEKVVTNPELLALYKKLKK
jgi:hypothetical protein